MFHKNMRVIDLAEVFRQLNQYSEVVVRNAHGRLVPITGVELDHYTGKVELLVDGE